LTFSVTQLQSERHDDVPIMFVMEFPEASEFECHSAIRKLFGSQYGVINLRNGIVEAKESELAHVSMNQPHLSHCFAETAQVPPIAKISKNVASISRVSVDSSPSRVELAIVVTPSLARAPPADKLEFAAQLGREVAAASPSGACSLVPDSRSLQEFGSSAGEVILVSLTARSRVPYCSLEGAALVLARLHRVQWVDLQRPVKALNRWAAPLCQSGDVDTPLLHWANITGRNRRLAVYASALSLSLSL
jgi:hypothetical protein